MKERIMRKAVLLTMAIFALAALVSCASLNAEKDLTPHSYVDVAEIPNFTVMVDGKSETVTAVEGCVVIDGYGYVAKVKNAKVGYLYRINLETGEKMTMINADTGEANCLDLYHANDMAAFEMDGKQYIVVGTLSEMSDRAVVVLELIDAGDRQGFTQFRVDRKYAASFKGMYPLSAYGVEIVSVDGHKIGLLIKSGLDFYTGIMDYDSDSTRIAFKKSFSIKTSDVLLPDGNYVSVNLNDYYQQGYTLHDGRLYVPFTRIKSEELSHSIVLVYDYNSDEAQKLPIMSETLLFQNPESTKFEIESFSFYDGKMYFSSNLNLPLVDGFHYFEF